MDLDASFLTLECRYGQTSKDIFTKLSEVLALGIESISKKFQLKIFRRSRDMEDLVNEFRREESKTEKTAGKIQEFS